MNKILILIAAGLAVGAAKAQVVSFSPEKAVDSGFRAYVPQPGDRSVGVKVTTRTEGPRTLAPNDPFGGAAWIWHPVEPQAKGFVNLRAKFVLSADVRDGSFAMSCDNGASVTVNGRAFARQGNKSPDWETLTRVQVRPASGLRAGTNLVEVVGENILAGEAGFLAAFDLTLADGTRCRFTTGDAGWEACRAGTPWVAAKRVADYGCPPWGVFNEKGRGRNPVPLRRATCGAFRLPQQPADGKVYLVCDEVAGGESAEIRVNGRVAGTFARPPHRLDITSLVCAGTNAFTTAPFKIWNPRVVVTDGSNTVGLARRAATGTARATRAPYHLTCEYLAEPLGVVKPRFFWKSAVPHPNRMILDVRSWSHWLYKGDVWHGEVTSQLYVEPPLALKPWTRYWWYVMDTRKTDVSPDATFVTGIANWRTPFFGPHWKKAPTEYWRARRTVELHEAKSVILGICSRGYHKLYVNGREVERTFGPNRSHIQDGYLLAETYDVTPFVREGLNEFAVLVADGWARACHKSSILSIDGRAALRKGEVTIDSSEPWYTSRVNDCAIGGWWFGCFGGERLHDVRTFSDEQPGVRVTDASLKVSCDVSPRDRVLKELPAVSAEKVGEKTWRVDFGEQFTGFVRLKLKGRPGTVVGFDMSDNVSQRRQFNQHSEFVFCADGCGEFASTLNWTAGRYAHLDGLDDLDPADVTGLAVGNFAHRTGSFTGDRDLERVAWLDNNTLVATSFSGVTVDCPHRERLGYGEASLSSMWGDGLPYFDSAAYYAAYLRKWASSQEPDGHVPHVSPDANGGGGTFWSNFPIYAYADFSEFYPDARLREVIRPVAAKWLDYLHSKVKDGLVRKYESGQYGFLGDWAFPDANVRDWGPSREALFFNNCSYAWAILRALEVDGLVPEPARRAELKRRHAALVAAIEKNFYAGDGLYLAPHARYQAIALVGGVAAAAGHAEATERALLDIVEKKGYVDGGSPSYTTILRVLCRSTRGRELLVKTFRRHAEPGYLFFVDQGYSTIPEYWNFGFHFTGSMIHTCFTGGAGALLRGLAGFEVKGANVTVAPFLSASLPDYAAQMETLYGTLKLKVHRADDGLYNVEVTCPFGCRGRFRADRDVPLQPGANTFRCAASR